MRKWQYFFTILFVISLFVGIVTGLTATVMYFAASKILEALVQLFATSLLFMLLSTIGVSVKGRKEDDTDDSDRED